MSVTKLYINEIKHPLALAEVTNLRNKNSNQLEFNRTISSLTKFLVHEALLDAELVEKQVETPVAVFKGFEFLKNYTFIPILRAGLGMLPSALEVIPNATTGFIGMKRDEETLEATDFWKSLPEEFYGNEIMILEPMIATGGSLVAALEMLKKEQVGRITVLSVIASKIGVDTIEKSGLCDRLYTISIDSELNRNGFIVPGLGDAGDRIFGIRG